ncbi:MAG: cysteine desulfurase family protein [Chlamydiae bacterium]|nr:cysteine desulfurase family protein [Chlamydiota bacterium]
MSLKKIFLDNNSTTLVAKEVCDAIAEELQMPPSNPSSIHSFGQQAKSRLLKARSSIADFLGVKPEEIIFTSGGTESMNWLIQGMCSKGTKGHIITSNVEHSCVEKSLKNMENLGWEVSLLPAGAHGAVLPSQVEGCIKKTTRLIIFGAANSQTGVKHDIEAIANIANRHKIHFIVDGVALFGKEPLTIPFGVSGMGFSSHKFHGPKGVGFAYIKFPYQIEPMLLGGSQEFSLRAGTENLPGIIGMAAAINILKTSVDANCSKVKGLRDRFEKTLQMKVCPFMINGDGPRVCNTSNLYFPGVDAETLLIQLDIHGIQASHGSACSSGSLEPSRILLSMGYSKERARSSIRFSLSRFTTEEEIEQAAGIIAQLVAQMRALA